LNLSKVNEEKEALTAELTKLKEDFEELNTQKQVVQREKEAVAQAMVKATSLIAQEKQGAKLKDEARMKFAVAAQLFCRLRQRDWSRINHFFSSWWTSTAMSGVVTAVVGINRTCQSKNVVSQAVLKIGMTEYGLTDAVTGVPTKKKLLEELEAAGNEASLSNEERLEKLKTLQEQINHASEEENYVRAARMKLRVERIQEDIRKDLNIQLAADGDSSNSVGGPNAPPGTARRGSLVDTLATNPTVSDVVECETLYEAIEKEAPQAAEAILSTGQYDMGPADVDAVGQALTKWPNERDVVWKACAVLACIAGDHGQNGADEVSSVTKAVSRGAKHHPDDPIVQANALNALRWVAENASPKGKMLVMAQSETVHAAMALHPEDKWTQSHGAALLDVMKSIVKKGISAS